MVDAFAEPENAGLEVMALAGRMVERLHERMARRTLELGEAIAALSVQETLLLERPKTPRVPIPKKR